MILKQNNIGRLFFNVQDHVLDTAYADTDELTAKSYTWIENFSDVIKMDGEMETEVFMNGSVSGRQSGRIN